LVDLDNIEFVRSIFGIIKIFIYASNFVRFVSWFCRAEPPDSNNVAIKQAKINKLKLGIVTAGTLGFGVVTYDYFNQVWWKPTRVKKFVWRDDWNDVLKADKAGHFYFSYVLSDVYKNLFKWVGFSSKTSAFLGAGISVVTKLVLLNLPMDSQLNGVLAQAMLYPMCLALSFQLHRNISQR
jgi:hypothetical protein